MMLSDEKRSRAIRGGPARQSELCREGRILPGCRMLSPPRSL